MKILLLQLDGSLPNIALMRLAAHYRMLGQEVIFERIAHPELSLFYEADMVYASLIFERTYPLAKRVLEVYPEAILGGTGWDLAMREVARQRSEDTDDVPATSLEAHGIVTRSQDYSLYPRFRHSIGFSQRGCRLKCPFCVVPWKEGKVVASQSIREIWRGGPWPKELLLLDNDFFGQAMWREQIEAIRDGDFAVCFSQGINARFLTDEAAEAIASIKYRDDQFREKRIYTAWDNRKDEERLFAGLNRLVKYGVGPDDIMVYILVGYWPGETPEDRDYRRRRLREFGARPYPMPYVRTAELVGFQRWVIGAYDKRPEITWAVWKAANYRPENLGCATTTNLFDQSVARPSSGGRDGEAG